MKKLITVLMMMLFATSALAERERPQKAEKFSMKPESVMVINLVITSQTLQPLYDKLQSVIISRTVPERMTIVLDSPGGSVMAGLRLIELMTAAQARGVKFDCVVHHMAASMAFQILTQCDERLTYDGALLLWHGARVFIQDDVMTGMSAHHLAMELEEIDAHLRGPLMKALGRDMSEKTIMYHGDLETQHIGAALAQKAPHFIKSASYVEGLYQALANPATTKAAVPKLSIFDMRRKEQFIYIFKDYESDYIETLKAK